MSEIKNMDFKYLMQNQQNINSSLSIQELEKKQVRFMVTLSDF